MPPINRSHKGTPLASYMLEGVSRRLIADARSKCKAQIPPITLKTKLVQLLENWTYSDTDAVLSTDAPEPSTHDGPGAP